MWAVYVKLEDGTPEVAEICTSKGRADAVVRSGRFGPDAWVDIVEDDEDD